MNKLQVNSLTHIKAVILFISTVLFVILIAIQPVKAQISLGPNGNVTIGDETIISSQKLRVECITWAQCPSSTKRAIYGDAANTVTAVGVTGRAVDAAFAIGVDGVAINGSSATYGVRGHANGSGSSFGGHFTGGLFVSGGITESSDARLKTNIRELGEENMLSAIMQLRPKRYEFSTETQLRNDGFPGTLTASGEHLGLLAQEVEEIFPNLVHEITHLLEEMIDADETLNGPPETVTTIGINYRGFIPVLISGLQQQQEHIQQLEARIEVLESLLVD